MLVFGQNRACEGGETADEGAFQRVEQSMGAEVILLDLNAVSAR